MKERRLGLIDILSKTKPPVLQFVPGEYWRVWTSYNSQLTLGTYIELSSQGDMLKVSLHPDGTQSEARL